MDSDSQQITELVESGEYFQQAREWYGNLYIGPVSERTFFLLIASLAGIVAFFAFIALMSFLPITDRPGLLISSSRIDERIPKIMPIAERGEEITSALMNFFVTTYVTRRESYSADTYALNYNFIRAQSDPLTFAAYAAQYGPDVKTGPWATLGQQGKRQVTIDSARISDFDKDTHSGHATVRFTSWVDGFGDNRPTYWTANLQFYYTDLVVAEFIDTTTGEKISQLQDPTFQVVSYALKQGR